MKFWIREQDISGYVEVDGIEELWEVCRNLKVLVDDEGETRSAGSAVTIARVPDDFDVPDQLQDDPYREQRLDLKARIEEMTGMSVEDAEAALADEEEETP